MPLGPGPAHRHGDGPAGRGEFQRVAQQVPEEPVHVLPVQAHDVARQVAAPVQGHVPLPEQALGLGAALLQPAVHSHVGLVQHRLALQQPGGRELVGQAHHAVVALLQNGGRALLLLPGVLRQEPLGGKADIVQRQPDLPGHRRQYFMEHLLLVLLHGAPPLYPPSCPAAGRFSLGKMGIYGHIIPNGRGKNKAFVVFCRNRPSNENFFGKGIAFLRKSHII